MNITVYGTGTSGHQYVVHSLRSILDKAAIQYSLKEVSDVNVFLDKGIESVPAVQLDEDPVINIRNNNSFAKSLREILHRTLQKNNFGALPKVFVPFSFEYENFNALVYGHRLATELEAVVQVSTVCNGSFDLDHLDSCSFKLEDIAHKLEEDRGGDILKSALITSSILYGNKHSAIIEEINALNPKFVVLPITDFDFLLEDSSDSLAEKIHQETQIPVLLIPPKAKFKRVRNVFCFCNDASCFEEQKDYFLKFSSVFDSDFSVFVGCPKMNSSQKIDELDNIYLSSNMDLVELDEIQKFDDFKNKITSSNTDFLFISESHCALKHYYRNSKKEFIHLMEDKPMLYF